MRQLIVHKSRTNVIQVSLGFDVSDDVITSQIRVDKDPESTLIATWGVAFATNGIDGELILTLDDSVIDDIDVSAGWMDLKRITAGQPVNVFDDPLEVLFKNVITV